MINSELFITDTALFVCPYTDTRNMGTMTQALFRIRIALEFKSVFLALA